MEVPQMGAVFISYRRGDSEGQARALSIELGELIGKDSVFMDVDSIALGRDFRQVLQERLQACDIMLALIGPGWLDAKDPAGNRRLDSPTDFVRQEISAALRRNIPVTPVLLQGALMPPPEHLPDDLKDLAFRNGFELSHTRWDSDVKEMLRRLGLGTPPPTVTAPALPVPSSATPSTPSPARRSRKLRYWLIGAAVVIVLIILLIALSGGGDSQGNSSPGTTDSSKNLSSGAEPAAWERPV
jgi:TIR domain